VPLAERAAPHARPDVEASIIFPDYHMSHPMHEVDGTSHAALGKGVCHAGQCDFLVAATVKSFDSGDSNRDLHMIQTTRRRAVSHCQRAVPAGAGGPQLADAGLRPRSSILRATPRTTRM